MMRKRPGRFQTPRRRAAAAAPSRTPHPLAAPALLAAGAALAAAGCDASWGGTSVTVEEWRTETPAPEEAEAVPEAGAAPLPEGPLLFAVRADTAGRALVAPVARLAPDGPAAPAWPDGPWEGYRARFDSAFLAPGSELALLADGQVVGAVSLGAARSVPDPACPTVAAGRLLVLPRADAPPGTAFAVARADSPAPPARYDPPAPDQNTRVYSGVLAERVLEEAGISTPPGLARVALSAVRIGGGPRPGIAATYLAGDSAAPGPPAGEALSLALLAGYDPARGYVPVWSSVRTYSTAAEKLVLEHIDWIRAPSGRVDLHRAIGATGTRLAALVWRGEEPPDGEEPWLERERCAAFRLLERAAGEGGA